MSSSISTLSLLSARCYPLPGFRLSGFGLPAFTAKPARRPQALQAVAKHAPWVIGTCF
jgi:hypothetical protein